MQTKIKDASWRSYQSEYIASQKRKTRFLRYLKGSLLALFSLGTFAVLFFSYHLWNESARTGEKKTEAESSGSPELKKSKSEALDLLSAARLNDMVKGANLIKSDKNIFFVDTPKQNFKITTSIDIFLQEYLLSVLSRLKTLTRGKPQRIAFVVMEPDTGKVLAMTGFDLDNPDANPCIESDYPAASIFKIVTAAAAVESLGYTPQTQLYYNGNKYTLYKRQLKDVKNKYSYKISFSNAFAESVNPVFGKIGKNYLGKEKLERFADAFGFNEVVNSEFNFFSGKFKTNTSEYHLAELGSGFNTDTTISPMFGAMMISAIINSGHAMVPRIVEHITGSDGEVIYKSKKSTYKTAIQPKTAATMMQLMERTITQGTARKAFRGASKDVVLSKLVIGGKTGSLYNREHTVKYDWFTGFGREKKGNKKIILSIVVGHRKYIGTRAGTYARMILKQYFKKKEATAQL